MDFVDRLSSLAGGSTSTRPHTSYDGIFKFTDLSPATQRHLQHVYFTLAVTLGVATGGVYFNMVTGFGDFLGFIAFMVLVPWLLSTRPTPTNFNTRAALLGGAAFSNGMILGPLVGSILAIHPGVVLTALLGTTAIFACFSGAALLSRRRSYLYLGGILSSVMSAMLMMRLGSWLFGGSGAMVFQAELYMGGLAFLGYILFDTQVSTQESQN